MKIGQRKLKLWADNEPYPLISNFVRRRTRRPRVVSKKQAKGNVHPYIFNVNMDFLD